MTEEGSELKISVGEISFYLHHISNLEQNVKWIYIYFYIFRKILKGRYFAEPHNWPQP